MNGNALRLLTGSMLVYLVVAACGNTSGFLSDGGAPFDASAILDGLGHPVSDARADSEQSGTRLKYKHVVGADGSKASRGLWDSQLMFECWFTTAADGSLRCLPLGGGWIGYYADSNCSRPLFLVQKGCAKPVYGSLTIAAAGVCQGNVTHVFMTGDAFPIDPTNGAIAYQTNAMGVCYKSQISGGITTTYDAFQAGSEVAPATFVAGTEQTDP